VETFNQECLKIHKITQNHCTEKFKFYIHLHIYYRDQVYSLLNLIESLNFNYFLIITITGEQNYSLYKALSKYENKYANILYFQNRGYDIYAFLKILSRVEGDDAVIAKIHTKPDQVIVGSNWRDECLRSLFHSDCYVNDVLKLFKEYSDLLMLGSSLLFKSTERFMYGNDRNFFKLLEKLNEDSSRVNSKSIGFFAGSMFWAKKETFNSILNILPEIEVMSLTENNNSNPSLWHAIERIFGVLPTIQNKKSYTVRFLSNNHYSICNTPKPSDIPLTQSF
jgi:lipopolysaccharide biosynthesis protein